MAGPTNAPQPTNIYCSIYEIYGGTRRLFTILGEGQQAAWHGNLAGRWKRSSLHLTEGIVQAGGWWGNSTANGTASRARLPLRFPSEEGGIHDAHRSSQIRYKTGMEKDEVDAFYEDTFWMLRETVSPAHGCLGELGTTSETTRRRTNKARRVIRGSMDDRDRVLCWLEILRRDTLFEDVALAYGRCAGTYHNEFKDMTAAAQNMPCLQVEIQWPEPAEQAAHCTFLQPGVTRISLVQLTSPTAPW
ncbi:unnamed protein product [Ectocarpus sp. CCAP 1310/34]|nr:unnamed protein product [Ectocarpus sp. CCAP 1310/34]